MFVGGVKKFCTELLHIQQISSVFSRFGMTTLDFLVKTKLTRKKKTRVAYFFFFKLVIN